MIKRKIGIKNKFLTKTKKLLNGNENKFGESRSRRQVTQNMKYQRKKIHTNEVISLNYRNEILIIEMK